MYYSNKLYAEDEKITLNSSHIPSAQGYYFVGWFDKDRPKGSGGGNKRDATVYTQDDLKNGKQITFPYNGSRFTLEALWAGIDVENLIVPYDGNTHTITAKKDLESGTLTETPRYETEIEKFMSDGTFIIGETKWQIYNDDGTLSDEGDTGTSFTRTEPGTYKVKVTVQATLKGVPLTLERDAYLIIYPATVTLKKIWVDWYDETGIRPEDDDFEVHLNQIDMAPNPNSSYNISAAKATGIPEKAEPEWIPTAADEWTKIYENVLVRPNRTYGNDQTSYYYDYTADEVEPTYYTKLSETRVVSDDKLSTQITIVNRIKKHPIEFIKWDELGNELTGAKFTITMIENARFDDDNASADDKKPNKNLTWEIEIGDKTVDLYEGFYKIEETAAPKGFGKIADQYFIVKDGKVTLTDKDKKKIEVGAISIDNTDPEKSTFIIRDGRGINITLKKVDKSNVGANPTTLLDGATFKIEKYISLNPLSKDTAWSTENSAEISGSGGVFTFSALPIGYYKIVETNMPAGYVKLADDPIFEVAANNETGNLEIFLLDKEGTRITGNKTDMLVISGDTIVFGNEPGVALPSTGGPGTRLFTILGSILVCFAGALLVRKRRRTI